MGVIDEKRIKNQRHTTLLGNHLEQRERVKTLKRRRWRHRESLITWAYKSGLSSLTFTNLLISKSKNPTFVPRCQWFVFITARVSAQVYITKPTADPGAKTVFDQRVFSSVNGEKVSGRLLRGTDESEKSEGVGLFNVNVPTKAWMSLIGESAEPNKN